VSAVCGEAPMAEGRHYAEFAVVKKKHLDDICVGICSGDKVMVALFALCDMHQQQVKFGYDWGGSSTAEAADKDPARRVPQCCLSLACSCGAKRSTVMIIGPVDWR